MPSIVAAQLPESAKRYHWMRPISRAPANATNTTVGSAPLILGRYFARTASMSAGSRHHHRTCSHPSPWRRVRGRTPRGDESRSPPPAHPAVRGAIRVGLRTQRGRTSRCSSTPRGRPVRDRDRSGRRRAVDDGSDGDDHTAPSTTTRPSTNSADERLWDQQLAAPGTDPAICWVVRPARSRASAGRAIAVRQAIRTRRCKACPRTRGTRCRAAS